MPRRLRIDKRRESVKLTPRLDVLLTVGAVDWLDPPDSELEPVWLAHRDHLIGVAQRMGRLPSLWGYWHFENVPEALRSRRIAIVEVGDDQPASEAERAAEEALRAARAVWLRERGGVAA